MGEVDTAPPPETVEHQTHSQEKAGAGCGQCGAECSGHHTEATESANNLFGDLEIGSLSSLTNEATLTPAGAPEKAEVHTAHGCDHVGCACHGHEASAFGDSLFGELGSSNTVSTNLAAESGHHHNHDHDEKSPHHHSHDAAAKTEAINSQGLSPVQGEVATPTTAETPIAAKPAVLESSAIAAAAAHASGENESKPDNASSTEQDSSASTTEHAAPHLETEARSSEAETTHNEATSSIGANSSVESAASGGPDVDAQSEQPAPPQNEANPDTSTKAAEQAQHESASTTIEKQPAAATGEADSSQGASSIAEAGISKASESAPADGDVSETRPPKTPASTAEATHPNPSVETVSVNPDVEPMQADLEPQVKSSTSETEEPFTKSVPEEASTHTDAFDLSEAEQMDNTRAAMYDLEELSTEDPTAIESPTELTPVINNELQLDDVLIEANDHEVEIAEIAPDSTTINTQRDDEAAQASLELDAPINESEQTTIEITPEIPPDNTAEATSNLETPEDITSVTDAPASERGVDTQEFDIDSLLEDIQLLHGEAEAAPIEVPEQEQQTNNIEAIDEPPEPSVAEALNPDASIEQDLERADEEVSLETILASLDSPQPSQELTQNTTEQTVKEQKNISLLAEAITANLQESYEKYQHLTAESLDKLLNQHNLILDEQAQQELLQLLGQASQQDLHDYIAGLVKLHHSSEDFGQEFASASAPSLWHQANQKLTRILTALRRFLPRAMFSSE